MTHPSSAVEPSTEPSPRPATAPYATVIADSTSADGVRLTTMEVCFHRFVLSEFNTHRVFSRNSASSRAIPIAKQITKLTEQPAAPLAWPAEKPGMQGGEDLDAGVVGELEDIWSHLQKGAVEAARRMRELGLHKSVVNRYLEPFMWHTVVVTSTAWGNFFDQRVSELAQPEIRIVAEAMHAAHAASEPVALGEGQWHLPYVQADEQGRHPAAELVQMSAARCARTSYLTQDGVRDVEKDLNLYRRLVSARPAHWSPLEHVATPWPANRQAGTDGGLGFTALDGTAAAVELSHLPRVGNLLGWRSLRTEVEATQSSRTFC